MKKAFDPAAIKKAEFVMPLWEAAQRIMYNDRLKYPTRSGKLLNFEAVQLAALIYHPRYGDGYRDQDGNLMVRDPKTREYRRATKELITTAQYSTNLLTTAGTYGRRISKNLIAVSWPGLSGTIPSGYTTLWEMSARLIT